MRTSRWNLGRVAALTMAVAASGCGGSDDSGTTTPGSGGGGSGGPGGGASTGTVTDTWREYCVATFSEDAEVLDSFGDPAFTARAGEEYLFAGYNDFFGEETGELLYVTPNGADSFDVPIGPDGSYPFTSNCEGSTSGYYAVFVDVTLYADPELTTELCSLSAGTVAPSSGEQGFSITGDAFSFSGPQTYEISLGGLSDQCGGASSGYVSVPQVQLLGVQTWLVPILGILGPG